MTIYPANLGATHYGFASFRPTGPLYKRGNSPLAGTKWFEHKVISARIFVGFSVGAVPTWTIENLIELVFRLRQLQGASPAATFLAQKGIYQHTIGGQIVVEDGAQVIIFLEKETPAEFENQMAALAEEIVKTFQQEEVILELQEDGIVKKTARVTP